MRIKIGTKVNFKRVFSIVTLVSFVVTTSFTFDVKASNDKIVYPLKEISKLKCRFDDFSSLSADCKEKLPVLQTKDYKKYIKKDGGYNDYTRLYTVLWGSSYKYGWDMGNGGHQGVDIATAKGTPVYSIADGTVIVAKKDLSWGNVVSIQHVIRGKKVISNYAHLSKIDVVQGQKVSASKKIGEVGNTGNSTGNHLHFQVDLPSLFHPFYYSWKTCPYSYYKITEEGVCFDELAENTLDPLKFLETEGGVLDDVEIQISQTSTKDVSKNVSISKQKDTNGFDMSIFEKTVHTEMNSSLSDVKAVQWIYLDLGYYKGKIDGKYPSVEESVIQYQLKNRVISSRSENGAGWFGPKTRAHTKAVYSKYLANGGKTSVLVGKSYDLGSSVKKVITTRKVEKISRTNILSREEIEEREINEFLRDNEVKLSLGSTGGNIGIGGKINLKLEVSKKLGRTSKPYKGYLPSSGITFELDESTVSVFPKKMTYISASGKRNIILTGKKSGNTTLKVKLGNKVIKSFPLKVLGKSTSLYPKTGIILAKKTISLGEKKTGIVVFKDDAGKNMINLPFKGTYILQTGDDAEVCIKRGSLKNVGQIYRSDCTTGDYEKNPVVTYSDTVGGLLLFDYKALSKDKTDIKLVGKGSGKTYSTVDIKVSIPKGLTQNYEYYNETVAMLESGVVDGTRKGYFMEDRVLTERDAYIWMENTLSQIIENTSNSTTKSEVSKKLTELKKNTKKSYTQITRKEFLSMSYRYLVISDSHIGISIHYKDLNDQENKKANAVFDKENTWKDQFGETHFQPEQKLTRGEGAYLLSKAMEKNQSFSLTLR